MNTDRFVRLPVGPGLLFQVLKNNVGAFARGKYLDSIYVSPEPKLGSGQ
jgi:hypothetical protein